MTAVVTTIVVLVWAGLSGLLPWLGEHWFALLVLYLLFSIREHIRGYIRAVAETMTSSAQAMDVRWREFTTAADSLNARLDAIHDRLSAIDDGVGEVDANVRAVVSEVSAVSGEVSGIEASMQNVAISTKDIVLNLRRGYN
jgi:hypothetical protein